MLECFAIRGGKAFTIFIFPLRIHAPGDFPRRGLFIFALRGGAIQRRYLLRTTSL
jgi:hypothetical protein